jgi:hypothetical protein
MSLFLELHFVLDCNMFGILISATSFILACLYSYSYCQPALHCSFISLDIFGLWIGH